MIGSLIAGRYRLDELIGQGGVAVVYKGLDTVLERVVAIKVLRDEMARQHDVVARFRREAHAAARLNHPNIVQIYDTGVEGETYYIVMEYLPEPDLKRIIKEYAPLPLRKVLEVTIQCARALAYAHKQGLIHRDVKPHNILFTDDGRVKLSDFGIAAAAGDDGLTETGLVLGSAYYISPEQAQGAPATAQSDIYSLGVVMFECVTGRPPFNGATPAEVAARHVRERPPSVRGLNPNVTPSAEYVINKAMARELTRRYRGADELLVDLEKIADGVELDRTGVLMPGGEEATMRLSPAAAPTSAHAAIPAGGAVTSARPVAEGTRPAARRAPERSPGSVAAATAAAVIIGVIALIGVIFLVKEAFYGAAPRKVQVPSVKGKTLREADTILTEAGLQRGRVTYEETEADDEGIVIRQSPDTNLEGGVEAGTPVDLVVSQGKKTVTVPRVERKTVAEATDRLREADLQVGQIEEVYNTDVPQGQVIRQRIPEGTQVNAGTAVDLTVSKGPEPETPEPAPEGDKADGGAEDPLVQIVPVEDFRSNNPKEHKVIVKVSAVGTESGQHIQVVVSDDENRGTPVADERMDAGASKQFEVVLVGNATIEVTHNGKVVSQDVVAVPTEP